MQSKIFGDALFDYKLEIFTVSVLKLNVQFQEKWFKEMLFLKVHSFLQVYRFTSF